VGLRRRFTAGEEIVLELPMRPRLTGPDPRVDAVRGCVAVERGPEVLCAESVDLPDGITIDNLRLDPGVTPVDRDGAVVVAARPYGSGTGPAREITLHPYHRWARRGPSTMRVWLPVTG
jgi:DUF1680 family protein